MAANKGLDSIQYEALFSKIKLGRIQAKLQELRVAGYEYSFEE